MKRRHFLGYSLYFIIGCSTTTTRNNELGKNKPDLLRFTVTDEQGLEALEQNYGKFRQALEEVLETKIEFVPVESYIAAVVAFQSNQVDLILTGPSEYVVIHARTDALPLIAIARQDYYSIIVVPEQSNIQSLNQLSGKTISLKKPGSTSGHLGPTKLLLDAGLKPNVNYQVMMLGSQEGMEALAEGKVDAWGGSKTDYEGYKISGKSFREIEKGSPLPNDLIVASDFLDPKVVAEYKKRIIENQDKLLQALVAGEETQKYKGSRLVPVEDSDYDIIRDVYQAIGEGELIR
ncbi:MAG: PhnD/SsuA/transferrin family substrate-binding protein [Limnoraphis robusta]|uniref:Phosphonate ABC transporter substrate-binding protein n=1 Tax=Limnoraphis robusta CS-951 TaxID=1637645 RepID=A0A0F5YIB1_9CYAN|nr:PhnD/SsuA/transferrin family substrate-binding protein [Limnoraphis robusta]KKD38508.1 phosphonate ABC transporter substrate-binding protein [Limnoraphis robusta CS-951]